MSQGKKESKQASKQATKPAINQRNEPNKQRNQCKLTTIRLEDANNDNYRCQLWELQKANESKTHQLLTRIVVNGSEMRGDRS